MTRPNIRKQQEPENCIKCGSPTHRKVILVKTNNPSLKMEQGDHKCICNNCQGQKTRYEDLK